MVFILSKRKQGRKISYISKKRICTNVTSHVHSSESIYTNTSNSANAIGYSNLPCINVHNKNFFITIITSQKETNT